MCDLLTGHDVLTGIGKADLAMTIKLWILRGWTTLEIIEEAVNGFRKFLSGTDLSDWPGKQIVPLEVHYQWKKFSILFFLENWVQKFSKLSRG